MSNVIEHIVNGKLHREDGPALLNSANDYYEWWNNGKLIATCKDGVLEKCINGSFTNKQKITIQEKWIGHERTLSLSDLDLCQSKQDNHFNIKPAESISEQLSAMRKEFNTEKTNNLKP